MEKIIGMELVNVFRDVLLDDNLKDLKDRVPVEILEYLQSAEKAAVDCRLTVAGIIAEVIDRIRKNIDDPEGLRANILRVTRPVEKAFKNKLIEEWPISENEENPGSDIDRFLCKVREEFCRRIVERIGLSQKDTIDEVFVGFSGDLTADALIASDEE